jgi:hypothetical protein
MIKLLDNRNFEIEILISDLTVRLNWLNWTNLGVNEHEVPNYLNLFKFFSDCRRDK